jgi:hypothetical protein
MATRFRRKLSPQESPTPRGHLGSVASRYLVGVVVFGSVELFRGDATFWPALITAALLMGFVLGGSLLMGRRTRADSGRFLLFASSTLFVFGMGAMIWRGFNWLLFALAIVVLLVGLGSYWATRQVSEQIWRA